MATYTESYFLQIGEIRLDYSGTSTVSTGWVDIDLSTLPDENFHFIQFPFDNYYSTGSYNASISFLIDGNIEVHQITSTYMELALSGIATKYKVDVSGTDQNSSGTLLLQYCSLRCYFYTDEARIPEIKILSVSNYKLSSNNPYNLCIVGLTSDLQLQYWELRATLPNEEKGHGKGILVESYTSLYAGETKYAYIDYDELSSGDSVYNINAFGQSRNGVWSDAAGVYNLLDLLRNKGWIYNAAVENNAVTFNTGQSNDEYSGISIDLYLNEVYQSTISSVDTTGSHSITLEKDASFDSFALVLSGDTDYGAVTIKTSMMENGSRYIFSYTIDSLSLNAASISNISIVNYISPENLFSLDNRVVIWEHNAVIYDDTVTYDTGTSNTEYANIVIDLFLQGDYKGSILRTNTIGNKTAIFNKDSSFDSFAIMLSGSTGYGSIECNTLMMENGSNYQISFSVDSLSLNHAVISNISLVKVV